MMKFISYNTNKALDEIEFTTYYEKKRNRTVIVNDDILCFDVETSSGFLHKNEKEIKPFDSSKSEEYYAECKKFSLVYLWAFSINEHVFVGRTMEDFKEFMLALDEVEPHKKYVYIHNLSYEFQVFLRNVYNDNFDKVFARKTRHVLFCEVGQVTYRCSYLLTVMSLEVWAKQKKLPIKKKVGQLDYLKLRTPKTIITDEELDYQISDVLVMYEGLKLYKNKYGSVFNIPLTQTGEVRREIQKRMNTQKDYKYRKNLITLIPPTVEKYKLLTDIFQGGYTHANFMQANRIINADLCGGIFGRDLASSYPTVMCLERYPMTPFEKTQPNPRYFNAYKYSFIIHFSCENLKSKLYNSYWSYSKTEAIKQPKLDNGRIISCSYIELKMTNVDYDMFCKCYSFDSFNIINFYVSVNDWLSPTFILYCLELYGDKTKLKGIEEYEEQYATSKQYINSMYGACVTRELTDDIIFEDGEWGKKLLDSETYTEKITYQKKRLSKIFGAFQFGVYVTAYARRNLWRAILELDKSLIYTDTDSVYYKGEHDEFFDRYNKEIEEKENRVAERLNVSHDIFAPKDSKGIPHRMGIWELEHGTIEKQGSGAIIKKFKTLGAKKYIYETDSGELKMTVSGVRKKAVEQINSIEQFNDGLVFDIGHAKKLISHYVDDMEEIAWNKGQYDEFVSTSKHGICMQPTTYALGITDEYLVQIFNSWIYNKEDETEILKHETKLL